MTDCVHIVESPAEITAAAAALRENLAGNPLTPAEVLTVFEAWAGALGAREIDAIPGAPFLKLWLRRGTLEPVIVRELGRGALTGDWLEDGRAKLRAFPVGVVGHWPAGNIEIQPILSLTCGLLGGNAALGADSQRVGGRDAPPDRAVGRERPRGSAHQKDFAARLRS